jgi:hypothetical protein
MTSKENFKGFDENVLFLRKKETAEQSTTTRILRYLVLAGKMFKIPFLFCKASIA